MVTHAGIIEAEVHMKVDKVDMRAVREAFGEFLLECIEKEGLKRSAKAAYAWRISRFDNGMQLVKLAESLGYDISRCKVLDVGCAFGGDLLAFAAAGAKSCGIDIIDHHFKELQNFVSRQGLKVDAFTADGESLPVPSNSFDLVLSLDVIEHTKNTGSFISELARVMKPGGSALITTPARWKYLGRDPHFQVPLLHALPQPLWKPIATRLWHRDYRYPVYRIYKNVSELTGVFMPAGLVVQAATPWSRKMAWLQQILPRRMFNAIQDRGWEVLIAHKSAEN